MSALLTQAFQATVRLYVNIFVAAPSLKSVDREGGGARRSIDSGTTKSTSLQSTFNEGAGSLLTVRAAWNHRSNVDEAVLVGDVSALELHCYLGLSSSERYCTSPYLVAAVAVIHTQRGQISRLMSPVRRAPSSVWRLLTMRGARRCHCNRP